MKKLFKKVAERKEKRRERKLARKEKRNEKKLARKVARAAETENEKNNRLAKRVLAGTCVVALGLGMFVGFNYGPGVISYLVEQAQKQEEPKKVCDPADDPVNHGNAAIGGGINYYEDTGSGEYEGRSNVHIHSKPMDDLPDSGPAEGTTWRDNVTGEDVHYGGDTPQPDSVPAGELPRPE